MHSEEKGIAITAHGEGKSIRELVEVEAPDNVAITVEGEPTHKYNSEGQLVPIYDHLTRKQRREIKRAQERRIKKLKKLKFQVDQEKKKLERSQGIQ